MKEILETLKFVPTRWLGLMLAACLGMLSATFVSGAKFGTVDTRLDSIEEEEQFNKNYRIRMNELTRSIDQRLSRIEGNTQVTQELLKSLLQKVK